MPKADLADLNLKIEMIAGLVMTQTEILKRVEEQTTKTNGRVTGLETWKAETEAVKADRKESNDAAQNRYWAPIITAVIVGLIFALARYWLPSA